MSALEAFLFLSGFTCAAVYLASADYRTQALRIVGRAWTIYRWQVALMLLLPLVTVSLRQRDALQNRVW